MPKQIIKNYILKHRDNYSKDQIMQALTQAGYKLEDINKVYYNLQEKKVSRKNNQSQGVIIFKIITFITLITYAMFSLISFLSNL